MENKPMAFRKKSLSLLEKALLAVSMLLLPILVTFIYSYFQNKEYLKKSALNDLALIAEAYEGQVFQLIEIAKHRVRDFSSDGFIRAASARGAAGDAAAWKALGEYLKENKLPVDDTLARISIVSMDGRVMASTDPGKLGRDVSGEGFSTGGREGFAVTESSGAFGAGFAAWAPVIDPASGDQVARIVNSIRLSELNNVMNGEYNRRLGSLPLNKRHSATMEVYLVGADRLLLTDSIFVKGAVMKQKADTLPVRSCLEKKAEVSGFYRDYRGVEVAGASMCLAGLNWTLVAEMDTEEVLAPAEDLERKALTAGGVAAAIAGALFLAFYRGVIIRLRAVSSASREIASGRYDISVPVSSGDEIGALTSSFNRMASEIKARSTELEMSEEKYRSLVLNIPDITWTADEDYRMRFISPNVSDVNGYAHEEICTDVGRWTDNVHPDDFEMVRSAYASLFTGKSEFNAEYRIRRRNGGWIWISDRATSTYVKDGVRYADGVFSDVTGRKMAEEKAQRINRLYSVLSRINEAIIRTRDTGGLFRDFCRIAVEEGGFLKAWIGIVDGPGGRMETAAACSRAGKEDEGPGPCMAGGAGEAGKTVAEGRIFICNDIEACGAAAALLESARRSGFRSFVSLPLKLNEKSIGAFNLYSGEVDFFNEDEIKLLESLTADISYAIASIENERQAKRANEDLKMMQSISQAVSSSEDFQSALKVAITTVCEATGWSFGEVWVPRRDGSLMEHVSAWYARPSGTVEKFIEISRRMTVPPGIGLPGRIWVNREARWIKDVSEQGADFVRAGFAIEAGISAAFGVPVLAGDEVLAVLVFFMTGQGDEEAGRLVDLVTTVSAQLGSTLQKRLAEDARLELQQRYEGLVNNLAVGVYRNTIGDQGRLVEANQALITMLGAAGREELLGHDISDFFVDGKKHDELTVKLYMRGFIKGEEVEMRTLGGRRLWASITAVRKEQEGESTYYDGIVEDITEHRKLEEQLVQAQKMEAVGQLAGGIAHDFNNILTAIIGYGNLLNMKKGTDDLVRGYSEHILSLADKASNLTQGLLAFSRKQHINPQAIELNELVRHVQSLLGRLIGEDIELTTELSGEDLVIKADSMHIEQVIVNLATNARDAMPRGGRMTIRTQSAEIGQGYLDEHGYGTPGGYALLTLSDSGKGMDEATKKRIFEPFFTTKEVGKGTGLGLAMVYGTVKQHNGFVNVESEPGKGTTFFIYLPLTASKAQRRRNGESGAIEHGTETVLLAEDQPDVRKISRTILEEFGYKVIEAVDGEDAMGKFMENSGELKLVILDVIMPKRNGKECFEEIKRVRPDMKVLFTSGYTADLMKSRGIMEEETNFIPKPAAPGDLLKKIREVLDN